MHCPEKRLSKEAGIPDFMRVLHITLAYTPAFQFGGPIQSIHAMNRALVRKGVEVWTLTTTAGLEDRTDLTRGWHEVDGVRVRYCRYFGYLNFTFAPAMFGELGSRARDFDLLHLSAVWNFPPLVGSLAARLLERPYMISPRGAMNREAMEQRSRLKKRVYSRLIAEPCFQRAATVHFTTEDEKDRTLAVIRLRNRMVVIPNGIDHAAWEALPEKGVFRSRHPILAERPYILFLGRLSPIKGLDLLVRAFAGLARENKDVMLVMAGPDSEGYGDTIREWVAKDGLVDRMVFTGMITGDDKAAALRDAEFLVLPSYSENFGMSVVEAMACATPVLISEGVGIHREVAARRAGLVVKGETEALRRGMIQLLADDRLRREIAENGKTMAGTYYNVGTIAEMMIRAYEEILAGSRGART